MVAAERRGPQQILFHDAVVERLQVKVAVEDICFSWHMVSLEHRSRAKARLRTKHSGLLFIWYCLSENHLDGTEDSMLLC